MPLVALLLAVATLGFACGGGAFGAGQRADAGNGTTAEGASDSFERAELGSSWTVHVGAPGTVAGSDLGLLSGSIAILSWAAPLPADQFSEAEVAEGIDPRMQRQVFVRRRASDSARYALHYNLGVSPQRWELKYDGVLPSQTRLLATAASPSGPVPGDVIRIEAEGETLRGYKNGRLVIEAMDRSPQRIVAGAPGMAFVLIGASVSRPAPVFERWAGGPVASPQPRITVFGRSGSQVLYSTVRPDCFSVRFASDARSRYAFTVTNARKRVVWKVVGVGEANVSRVLRWCGRAGPGRPDRGTPLPVGRYRAKLEVSAAPVGRTAGSAPFFARAWTLDLRTGVVRRRYQVSKEARLSRPVTTGGCRATRSTRVAGWRLRCLGAAGTARITFDMPLGRKEFLSAALGKVKVRGIGSYSSATAVLRKRSNGPRVVATVVVRGRRVLDIEGVTVPVVVRFRR